jgi:hypothetical protein
MLVSRKKKKKKKKKKKDMAYARQTANGLRLAGLLFLGPKLFAMVPTEKEKKKKTC